MSPYFEELQVSEIIFTLETLNDGCGEEPELGLEVLLELLGLALAEAEDAL